MYKKGFSLVELSIVIVIIGLLIAGVASGQKLVKQAEIRSLISKVDNIQEEINTFYVAYGELPGDFSEATAILSVGSGNGNGDNVISFSSDTAGAGASEVGRVFEHLSLALGNGTSEYTATNLIASDTTAGRDSVPNTINDGAIIFTSFATNNVNHSANDYNQIGGNSTNVIRVGGFTTDIPFSSSFVGAPILTVSETILLDRKIDDGLAMSGRVTGHNGYVGGGSGSERCLLYSSGTSYDPSLGSTGGATYNTLADEKCNITFDTNF